MKIQDLLQEQQSKTFLHGSQQHIPLGTILTGRQQNYIDEWKHNPFFHVLEKYRPNNRIAHYEAVFMSDNIEDLELASGLSVDDSWIFIVKPQGPVSKHDVNWGSEIDSLISEGFTTNDEEVIEAAKNYWNGFPHKNESVWEYLTTKAKVIDSYEED